jgi:hypothetical protein
VTATTGKFYNISTRRAAQKGQSEKTAPLETVTNGVWSITIKSILETEQDFLLKVGKRDVDVANVCRGIIDI